jgi:hypothetical protein
MKKELLRCALLVESWEHYSVYKNEKHPFVKGVPESFERNCGVLLTFPVTGYATDSSYL